MRSGLVRHETTGREGPPKENQSPKNPKNIIALKALNLDPEVIPNLTPKRLPRNYDGKAGVRLFAMFVGRMSRPGVPNPDSANSAYILNPTLNGRILAIKKLT